MPELSKEDAMKFLSAVPEEKKFFCQNGESYSSINELEAALKAMSEDTFNHHVNSEKNDFANWIYDVIGNTELANAIRKSNDVKSLTKELKKNIKNLKKASK